MRADNPHAAPTGAPNAAPVLAGLTGLRFLAATWVLLFHAMPRAALPNRAAAFSASGYLAVGLFFVLSGFILAHVYGDAAAHDRLPRRAFWRARFARVYPAYAAALVVSFPLTLRGWWSSAPIVHSPTGVLVSTPLMLQAWVPGWGAGWNAPGWSLSVEAFFYLLFPFIAPPLMRRGFVAACAIGISCVGLTVAATQLIEPTTVNGSWWLLRALSHFATAWTPLLRLPEFVLGICAARVWQLRPLPAQWRAPAATAATVALLAAAMSTVSAPQGLRGTAAVSAASAVLISALASAPRSWLGHPAMVRLGNASYSLYLFHATLNAYFLAIANRLVSPAWAGSWSAFAVFTVVAVGCALLIHDRVELPARQLLRGRAGSTRAPSW